MTIYHRLICWLLYHQYQEYVLKFQFYLHFFDFTTFGFQGPFYCCFWIWIIDVRPNNNFTTIPVIDASSIVPSAIVVFVAWKTFYHYSASFHQSQLIHQISSTVEIFEFSSICIFSAVTLIEPPWSCWELAAINRARIYCLQKGIFSRLFCNTVSS